MSDIEKFISERKARSPRAWANFEDKYRRFAIGMLLAEHREKSGLTLSQFAKRVKMQKTALSRLENHGEDVRLSTITRYVEATGRSLELKITPNSKRHSPGRKLSALIELVST
ncbi:MAG TPA: helix-turn-helix transcriptional regulator [Opitutaceae bacterium]|jgi:transcriptional regulator with XRE-family HTH domain